MSLNPDTRSYLSETISALSPWSSRSTTPKVEQDQTPEDKTGENYKASSGGLSTAQRGGDHSVSHWHWLSPKSYPSDCPTLTVQWFHAVDVALRKPNYAPDVYKEGKPALAPKKWMPFSTKDSRAIETAFAKLSSYEHENVEQRKAELESQGGDIGEASHSAGDGVRRADDEKKSTKVAVNEDYLFDVDIENRELAPAYWVGPVYAVRRGTWFYVEGSNLKPCEENLALQLEEGYLKTSPWRNAPDQQRSSSQTRGRSDSASSLAEERAPRNRTASLPGEKPPSEGASNELLVKATKEAGAKKSTSQPPREALTHRLFGAYMSSVATYPDSSSAYIVSDDFFSRMSSTMYQRFAGGAHLSGTKLVRGYQDISKKKDAKDSKRPATPNQTTDLNEPIAKFKFPPAPSEGLQDAPRAPDGAVSSTEAHQNGAESETDPRARFLQRKVSNLVSSAYHTDPAKQEEEARQWEEKEIREDYRDTTGDAQDRDIEHLVLVTHGIGQRLGARFETFNFIHDVNEFRKTIKTVYSSSDDLQALNAEIGKQSKNCRVQVLPICWRHLLDFPQQSLKHNRMEYDLGEAGIEEDEEYPSLGDITVEGVPALRNIISDLALDVLLYQAPAYKTHISKIVARECNRIAALFKERNPTFHGKVSLIGHSLGSAVLFDLLSDQTKDQPPISNGSIKQRSREEGEISLDFDVENLICFGSPIGLFQMLNGRWIAGRTNPNEVTLDGSHEGIDDPFQESRYAKLYTKKREEKPADVIVSSPKCKQLYNIFHPTDPVGYRMEPLISPSMVSLKPQPLPYTKRSFLGAPIGQGITGIPAMVGQTVSGFWSNFSSNIASNFVNRSIGISAEDAAKLGTPLPSAPHSRSQSQSQSPGAGTNITVGGVISSDSNSSAPGQETSDNKRKRKLASDAAEAEIAGHKPTTLIDTEIETLYSGFQNRRKQSTHQRETDDSGRRLSREEAKVRALNSNGRVDYSIQEGAFDISFLASIASHLAYWTDSDVAHFLLSQMLSRQSRKVHGKFQSHGVKASLTESTNA